MATLLKLLNNPRLIFLQLLLWSVVDLIIVGNRADLSKSDWATWVQAVGSIGAIFAAFMIGARQADVALMSVREAAHLTEKRRIEAVLGMVEFANSLADKCLDLFREDGYSRLAYVLTQVDDPLENLTVALNAIPMHEIGSAHAVSALIQLRSSTAYLEKAINRLLGLAASIDPGAHWSNADTSVVRLCCKNIKRAADQLQSALLAAPR